MKKVCVWGAAELGEFTVKQIKAYFKNWSIECIVDKNQSLVGYKKNICGISVNLPDILKEKNIDLLIIASYRWKEISEYAISKFDLEIEKILYVETIWPQGLQMNPKKLWEKLYFRTCQPDNAYFKELVKELAVQEGGLNGIGIKYNTDKASIMLEKDSFRLAHDYLRHYDELLEHKKDGIRRLCELGCGYGASLKMWKEYLPKTHIVGVDINPDAKRFEEENIDIVVGNAAHMDTICFMKAHYGTFSVIIDDASHAWGDMRLSFENLWDALEAGGYYIIEDVQCGSMGAFPEYPPVVWDAQPIFEYILSRAKIMAFGRDWNPEYNTYHFEDLPKQVQIIERELDQVTLIHGAVIIKKR